jgi:PAS domain S-box-containing protein
MGEGFFALDAGWRFTFFNRAAEKIFGMSRADVIGRTLWEVSPRIRGTEFERRYRDIMRERVRQEFATPSIVRPDRYHEVRAFPFEDGIGVAFRDITDRHAADAALQRERELLNTIVDRIPVMITMYEHDKKVLRLNTEFERVVGWSEADVAGRSLMEECYPDPDYRASVASFMDACREGWMDIRMRCRDGRMIDTSWANIRLSEGTQLGIGIDITARKMAEMAALDAARQELEQRRLGQLAAQRLAAIVESSDDAILSKDLNGIITSWNAGAERLFGYKPEEVIGKSVMILIPDDRAKEEPVILARIRRGERIDHYETVRRRKDGSLVDISLSVSPIKSAEDKVVGASKIARDISDRRRAEERQRLLLREMNHRVKNLFSVAGGLVTLSARHTKTASELARAVRARLDALARAHSLTLPGQALEAEPRGQPTVHSLIRSIAQPYETGIAGARHASRSSART